MDLKNLVMLFGPNIVKSDEVTSLVQDMPDQCKIIETLIKQVCSIKSFMFVLYALGLRLGRASRKSLLLAYVFMPQTVFLLSPSKVNFTSKVFFKVFDDKKFMIY